MRNLGLPIFLIIFFTYGVSLACFSQSIVEANSDSSYFKVEAESDTSNTLVLVDDIRISGYKKTKPYIIQREVPFKKGDHIPRSELQKKLDLCRHQVMNTSLFVDVEVTIAKQEYNKISIDIKVKERWYLFPLPYFKLVDRNLNQWWVEQKRSLDRVNYGLKFMQNNVSGRNDNLNIWLVSGYTQQVSFRYENPFLDKNLKHGMNIGFAYSRNREINDGNDPLRFNRQHFIKLEDQFITKLIHVDMTYSYRPLIKTRHNFRMSYSDQTVADTVLKSNPKFFPNGLTSTRFVDFGYTLQYYNVDYIPYPLKGFTGEGYFYKRGVGSKNNIWQIGGRGNFTTALAPKAYVQFQAAGLVKVPFKQPYIAQRMFGGSDLYLRGLEYYVIDGVAGGVARATVARKMLDFNIKSPIKSKTHDKIPFRIFLKTFTDLGYSYNPEPVNSFLNNKLLRTWGAGIDLVTFYDMVLKVEYSINQMGEKGIFIHTKSDF